MRSRIPVLDQPLTKRLIGTWLAHRQHWFSRHVECAQRAFDPDGTWRGRLVEPSPRIGAVRATEWARYLSTHFRRPVAVSDIMATGVSMELPSADRVVIRRTLDGVRSWRRHRMAEGPFKIPDSQDAFQIFLTREMLHSADH